MKHAGVVIALIGLVFIIGECLPVVSAAAGGEVPPPAGKKAIVPGTNLAQGQPYSFSKAPTDTWYKLIKEAGRPLPDVTRALTDGIVENSLSFWTSSHCVSFKGINYVDVVVDLQEVCPIAEIGTRHTARPIAGCRLPMKEEYFVSEDGTHYVKVGQFDNPKDPMQLAPGAPRTAMWEGLLAYTSGPIKAKGRYVAVRTHTYPDDVNAPAAMRFTRYIGYDEITVLAGNFKPGDVTLDPKKFVALKTEFDPSVFGYRISPPDWARIARETPLFIALSPQQFLGDNEYHLSVGGTYVFTFQCYNTATGAVTGGQFSCDFPATLTVHDYNTQLPLVGTTQVDHNGVKYTRYTQKLLDGKFDDGHVWPTYVVSTSATKPAADLGTVYYQYSYTTGSKKYDSGQRSLKLVLHERIAAPAPKKVMTGFWVPYYLRHFAHKDDTAQRLFAFYREAGFNCASGGQTDAAVHGALMNLGMDDYTGSGLSPNALMFALFFADVKERMQKEIPFVFHPQARDKKPYGVCPTKFLDPKYDAVRVEVAKRILPRTTHIYENWEPYMFMKQGCVCGDCKEAYRKFAKLSKEEVDKQWPDVVMDEKAAPYNDFISHQYGDLVLALQRAVTEAGKELMLKYHPAYVLSINPGLYYDPQASHFAMHNARDYFGGIDKIMIWAYNNTVSMLGVDASLCIGNNLTITRQFDQTMDMVHKYGRKVDGGYLPKVYYLPTEQYEETLVLPADNYFMAVLTFVHGMDGCGTWTMNFKQDARYLEANARANALTSLYEDVVRGGSVMAGCKAELASPAPQVNGAKVNVVYARGFSYQNRRVVALGADHYLPTVMRLKVAEPLGDGTWQLVDRINQLVYCADAQAGFTAPQLAEGVLIDMPAKSWRMLELVKTGDPAAAGRYDRRTAADTAQALDALKK